MSYADHGRIYDNAGSNPYWYYKPSIGADATGRALIAFSGSRGSAGTGTERIGAFYVSRSAAGQISGLPALIAAGRASCGLGRWGDYSAVARDPSDTSLWTVQEFEEIASGGGAWGTWICEVKSP